MPHVVIKLVSGRSEQQKVKLAQAVTRAVMEGAQCAEASVSVSIEDIEAARWTEDVYHPEIRANWDRLYRKPGYEPK